MSYSCKPKTLLWVLVLLTTSVRISTSQHFITLIKNKLISKFTKKTINIIVFSIELVPTNFLNVMKNVS